MNRKQLIILLALVAVAAAAALLVYRGRTAGWENGGGGDGGEGANILSFAPDVVDEVDITGAAAAVNLTIKNGEWVVRQRGDYPANFVQVAGLIRTAWEIKPVQAVDAGPSQLPRFELAAPGAGNGAGTLVEFKGGGGKLLASLLLGKKYIRKNPDQDLQLGGVAAGRYVMAADGKNRPFLVSETLDEFDPRPEKWLIHDFIKVENIQAIAVSGTAPADGWQVARDSVSSVWKLLEPKPGEQINLIRTSAFAGLLSNASFEDVLTPGAKTGVTGLDKPVTVDIVTFDHFSYRLKIGKLMGGDYPVEIQLNARIETERQPGANEKPADKAKLDGEFQARQKMAAEKLAAGKKFEGHTYLMAKSVLDPVLVGRSQMLLPGTPTAPAAGVSPAPAAGPLPAKPSPSPGIAVTTQPVAAPTPQKSPAKKK